MALTTISAWVFTSNTFATTAWVAGRYCGGDGVGAYGVIILWQSTDFYGTSPPPTTATGLGLTMSTASCISATTVRMPTANETAYSNPSGLAIGDKISISVGLGVGIPSVLCAVWGVLYARKSYKLKMAQLKIKKQKVGNNPAAAEAVQLQSLTAEVIARTDEREELINDVGEVVRTNINPTIKTSSILSTK